MRSDEVRVTRMDDSDFGSERRVEVHLGKHVIELVVCDGMTGYEVQVFCDGYANKLCDAQIDPALGHKPVTSDPELPSSGA